MAKTNFGPGVIVTSQYLNGAREIFFDGADLDWHYAPINRLDIQRGGQDGLDNTYVTLNTEQTSETYPITGNKSFMGMVEFGSSLNTTAYAAPKSWSTNAKFNSGGVSQNFALKYSNLKDEDLVTKYVLQNRIENFPAIDEGRF
jgi:hypothetical protein